MARGSSALGGLQGFAVAAVAAAAALLVVVAAPRCTAQATSGCTVSILSLAPCLSFTAGNTSAPGASCCSALAGVVRGAPRCLCAVLGGGAASSFGVTVNATRALELPGKCRVQTPPVSQCNAVGAPASSPPAAATPGAGSTPVATVEAPTAPSPVQSTAGAGSKATPATGAVSSDAGVTRSAVVSVSFVVAIASLMAF
ncbi:non-specific lipid-transfer protein-like protein [Panicum miliaceum]|uniref:Non-specific lipid-transfer protein-like protein n=1 Tax=Panicum miliaceum TaxID=4540 RepID=A0A3L6QT64_PANMI|nr:non-specific lipid-transfer protein-like protein [Panicum miliaceum]